MNLQVETLSRPACKQLAYAASFQHSTLVYGANIDTAATHLEIERAAGSRVAFCDQRTVLSADEVTKQIAKADKIHIALDWIVTPEIVAVLRQALGRRAKRRVFAVLSTCVMLPSDLGVDLREVFPILIAWDEVL